MTTTKAPQARPMAGEAGALLSAREVAERLGVSRSKAHRMLADGELPTVRFGGNVRVRVGDLDAWVARRVVPARRGTAGKA